MTELTLAGGIDSALTHMALAGLAAILHDRTNERPRIWWTQDWPATPTISVNLGEPAIGQAVIDHAAAHTEPTSWVALRLDQGPRKGNGLFTVRATPIKKPDEWQSLADRRREALKRLEGSSEHTPLDARMLVGLGEPAYWWHDRKPRLPDYGASRWEMKTRNAGQEFIRDRLSALGTAVAARTLESVLAGLTGDRIQDEAGKNRPDSRTPTGLTTPRAADNALAWCALWGLSIAPTIQRLDDPASAGMSQSPGTWPRNKVHPLRYALPVFTQPTTTGRISAILTSLPFDQQLQALALGAPHDESRSWLCEQGVRAIVVFPTLIVGSDQSSERQLLTGTVHPM